MKIQNVLLAGLFALSAVVSGCSGPPPTANPPESSTKLSPDPVAPTQDTSVSASPTPDSSASTSPTPSSAIEPGPTAKSEMLTVKGNGGYTANVALMWHEVQELTATQLRSAGCLPSAPIQEIAARGVVVQGKADFPETNGFVWPQALETTINFNVKLGDATCGLSSPGKGDGAGNKELRLSPSAANFSVLFLEISDKNPNNPNGYSDGIKADVVFGNGSTKTSYLVPARN